MENERLADSQMAEMLNFYEQGRYSRDEYLRDLLQRELTYLQHIKDSDQKIRALSQRIFQDNLCQELLNKQGSHERLIATLKYVQQFGGMVALIKGDLDLFKPFNDTYGHPAGDEVLKEVGRALHLAASRKSDTVTGTDPQESQPAAGRDGGDEFKVILPWTPMEGASVVAQKAQKIFKQNLEKRQQDLKDKSFPKNIKVTPQITFGIAVLDFSKVDPTKSIEQLASELDSQADDTLYMTKLNNKGGVGLFDPNDPGIIKRQQARAA